MRTKITDYRLNQMLKMYDARTIIFLHSIGKITLTSKQLDKIIKLKNMKGNKNGKRKV